MDILEDTTIDVFFIALHGRFGEDGRLQQILEDKALVYTGSGPKASRLAFDKLAAKKCFAAAGITAPKAVNFDTRTVPKELEQQLLQLGNKYVVKPVHQGSTIGVTIADNTGSALDAAHQGREITVGIIDNKTLPIIEIKTKTGLYDYQAKYIDEQTQFLFDTIQDPALTAKIEAQALNCFNALGCRHFARVDLILAEDQKAYVLEANTIPGLTAHSLLPKAAAKAGLTMSDLCVKIIKAALQNKKKIAYSI